MKFISIEFTWTGTVLMWKKQLWLLHSFRRWCEVQILCLTEPVFVTYPLTQRRHCRFTYAWVRVCVWSIVPHTKQVGKYCEIKIDWICSSGWAIWIEIGITLRTFAHMCLVHLVFLVGRRRRPTMMIHSGNLFAICARVWGGMKIATVASDSSKM